MTEFVIPRKLIEVAMPLQVINEAAAREKSIRHGHPSTLHLWWARRPLAAARAVLFGQLVNDPESVWRLQHPETEPSAQQRGAWTKARARYHELIGRLVQWENTTNQGVLDEARAEIRKSWRETCQLNAGHPQAAELFDPERLPAFHDPFAGGGAIPLEAQRLGLESHASDLNPVAVLINKAMIEIPPKFAGRPPVNPAHPAERTQVGDWSGARGLAEDVRYYGQWMRDEAEKRIGHLYPRVKVTAEMAASRPDLAPLVGQELTVIAWLWARTVKSPNPAFALVDVPLASTFMLSTKAGKDAYVEPVIEGDSYRFTVKVGKPKDGKGAKNGTKLSRGANFQCLMSTTPISGDYVKAEGTAGRMGARMMAIVAEGIRGRVYLAPTPEMEAIALTAQPSWSPETPLPDDPRNFWTPAYGLTTYGDLFTPRQLVALTTFSDLVQEARERVKVDALAAGHLDDEVALSEHGEGAVAYGAAVCVYLDLAVSKETIFLVSLARWRAKEGKSAPSFGRQAIPMVWDYTDINPFAGAGGDFLGIVDGAVKTLLNGPPATISSSVQADAGNQTISGDLEI